MHACQRRRTCLVQKCLSIRSRAGIISLNATFLDSVKKVCVRKLGTTATYTRVEIINRVQSKHFERQAAETAWKSVAKNMTRFLNVNVTDTVSTLHRAVTNWWGECDE